MNTLSTYYPQVPLDELQKSEVPDAIKYRMDTIISQSEFLTKENNFFAVGDSMNTRQGRAAHCRRIWQNTAESRNYDYLYNNVEKEWTDPLTGESRIVQLVPPAEVRHIPIVRPMLQSLASRSLERPIRPSVYTISQEAVQAKLERHVDEIREAERKKLLQRFMGVQFHQRGIDAQQQLLQQIQQAQQQGQEVDPRLIELLPQIQATIEDAKMMMEAYISLTNEEREKINNFYQYSYKDVVEQAMEKLLVNYIERNAIQQRSAEIFEEKMISDEPILHIWWEEGMQQPTFKMYRPEQIAYPIVESDNNIRDLDYCCVYDPLTYSQFVEEYGDEVTSEDLAMVRSQFPNIHTGNSHWTNVLPDGRFVDMTDDARIDHTQIDRYIVFWKEHEKIAAVERETKYGEKYYEVVDKEYKPKKGEKIVKRYRTCLYKGVRIGNERFMYLKYGKSTWQPRPLHNPSQVFLPFVSKAVSQYWKAHSLVWETRDIQEFFNILHYQEEQAIILAGLRGIVYDISQRPEGMSMEEVIYYMKRGLLVIQTVSENGTRKNSSFNQFPNYDQSISPALGVIGQIKAGLVELVRMITGVTAQQQGQVLNTDQVGTYKMGLAMSTAAVEIYFQQHEWQMEQGLEMLADAIMECESRRDTLYAFPDGVRQRIVALPKGVRENVQVKINSGRRTQRNLEKAEMAINQALQGGMINLTQYLQLSDMQSLSEMQVAIKDFEEKARAITESQGQQQQQMAMQMQQQAMQMKMQMDAQLEQIKGQMSERLEQIKGQIELQKAQMQAGIQQADMAITQQIAQIDDATKRYGIDADQYIESQYLELQRQQMGMDSKNKHLDRALSMFEQRIKAASDTQKKASTTNKIRD